MAYSLNKLRDFRPYRDISISTLNNELDNSRKGQLVIHIGTTEDDINTLLQSRTFKHSYFNSFYTDRRLISYNRRLRVRYSRQHIYKEMKRNLNRTLRTRNHVDDYNGYNLIVDATKIYNLNIQSMTRKRAKLYLRSLGLALSHANQEQYKEVVVVFNLDSINEKDSKVKNVMNIASVLNYAVRRKREIEMEIYPEQNVTMMIGSMKNNHFFKLPFDFDFIQDNRGKFMARLDTMVTGPVISDPEMERPEDQEHDPRFNFKQEIFSKKEETKKNVKDRLVSLVTKKEPEDLLNKQLNKSSAIIRKIDKLVDEKIDDDFDFTDLDPEDDDMSDVIYDELVKDDKVIDELADSFEEEVIGKANLQKKKVKQIKTKVIEDDIEEDIEEIVDSEPVSQEQEIQDSEEIKRLGKILELSKKQDQVINNANEKFKNNFAKSEDKKIERNVTKAINTLNDEININMMSNDFDTSYQEKQLGEDIVSVFASFNEDIDIPLYIDNINIEDTSDSQTYKDTLRIKLRDEKDQNHSINVDVPKVYDGKYMRINGSKKNITKQLIMLPIIKSKPDEVWITTNSNKITMQRFGRKDNTKTNYLTRLFNKYEELQGQLTRGSKLDIRTGNSSSSNGVYPVGISYMDISSGLASIHMKSDGEFDYTLNFNQKNLLETIENLNMTYDEELYYPIGFSGTGSDLTLMLSEINRDNVFILNKDDNTINRLHGDLPQFLVDGVNHLTGDGANSILSQSVSVNESMTYSRCKIINRQIPTIILLASELGLIGALDRAGISYEISEKNRRLSINDNQAKYKFKNGYIFFNTKNFSHNLLMAGLNTIDTRAYDIEEMETKEPYLDYFETNFNSRNVSKGVHNALTLMVDPITKEVLEDLGQPTDIFDILIYANDMLDDLSSNSFNDMNIYRMRTAEQIPAVLYKLLSQSYKDYKDSYANRNPSKVSLPKDALIKSLVMTSTVDESSDLNPSLELDKQTAVTYRGPSGRNDDNSFTEEIRGYDQSMEGILSIPSPDSNTVGIVRQLSYNAELNGVRGYLNTEPEDLDALNTLSPLELLNPFTSRHADAPRIGMQTNQQKHIISTATNDRPLITSGIDRVIPYQVSDVFAVKAKQDGKVERIDKTNGLLILRYKDDTTDVFDIAPKMNKNSTGGFYVEQNLELLVEADSTFRKGDILAKNNDFFVGQEQGDISYAIGKLSKIAISANASTYEDSSLITSSMAEDMASKITMRKAISIDKKANIQYVVKEGQKIATGQPLVIFEPEFDEGSINDLLDKLGSEFEENIEELSNKVVKSRYTGRIAKVNIYYNVDPKDCSPSVKKMIDDFIVKYEKKEKAIKRYLKDNDNRSITIQLPTVERVKTDKIQGETFDGVLLEVFTEYHDDLNIGDKISFYSAIKTIISDVIPRDQFPYSASKTDEAIEAVISPLSIVSRMTPDVYQMMFGNKVLLELKNQIKEIVDNY